MIQTSKTNSQRTPDPVLPLGHHHPHKVIKENTCHGASLSQPIPNTDRVSDHITTSNYRRYARIERTNDRNKFSGIPAAVESNANENRIISFLGINNNKEDFYMMFNRLLQHLMDTIDNIQTKTATAVTILRLRHDTRRQPLRRV